MRKLLLLVLLIIAFCQGYSQSCDPPKASGVSICANSSAVLIATGGKGEYRWYDALAGGNLVSTGAEFATPVLGNSKSYYVEVINDDCISPRTTVTVTVGLKPTVSGANICQGTSTILSATGPGGLYEWFDASSGGTLLFTGPSFTTPTLNETSTFYVQTTINGCASSRTAVTVSVNERQEPPETSDVSICAGSSTILNASGPPGSIYQWFSSLEGGEPLIVSPDYTTPPLNNTAIFYVQSVLNGCTSIRRAVTVTVNPVPSPPKATSLTICGGSTATLIASGGDSYVWFAVPSRGNPIGTGEAFTTPILDRTTTYYVQTLVKGCESARTAVTVTVPQTPDAPTVTGQSGCFGSSVSLRASTTSDAEFSWFDSAEGGKLLASTAAFITPVLSSDITYYVQASIDGCISSRTAVNVTLSMPPASPVISDSIICSGNSLVLSADSLSVGLEWYDGPFGGNLLFSGPRFSTPPLTTTTIYYVQTTANSCVSERVPVKIYVKPLPPVPTVANATICSGNSVTLAVNPLAPATSAGVVEYQWYDAVGILLAKAPTFTTPVLNADVTYYVEAVMDGCASARVPASITVSAFPEVLFNYPSATFCKDSRNPSPIRFTALNGVFSAQPSGIVFKSTATGEIDMAASSVGSYKLTFTTTGTCPGTSSILLTITEKPNPEFRFEGPYCQGGANPLPTSPTGGSGGIFSSTPGLVFAANAAIDLQRTIPGVYIITNTIPSNGSSCETVFATDTVVILPSVQVNAGPDKVVKPGQTIQITGVVSHSSKYVWSGGKGTFTDTTSLATIYNPAPGEYSVKLFLTAIGIAPCLTPMIDTVNISVLNPPVIAEQTICSGSTATLKVDALPSVIYEWFDSPSGGNPLFVGSSFVTHVLTASTTYFVSALLGGITSSRVPVKVNVLTSLEAPLAQGTGSCSGNIVSLTATGGTGTFQWYDASSGGKLLGTMAEFITPVLTQTTTFYVQQSLGNCVSLRTPVTVTVAQKPLITSPSLFTMCDSTALNYQITVDQAGASFSWSRAAVPGISNEALTGQTSALISEVLKNTSVLPVEVTYDITPVLNGCTGPSFKFVVTVDPSPVVISSLKSDICNNSSSNYSVTYNLPGTNFSWSRDAVAGISNQAISGQRSATIREILTNTTNVPIDVTYLFHQSYDGCASPPVSYIVTVNPSPKITSPSSTVLCNKNALSYTITTNIQGATYVWSRAAVAGISNLPVNDQTSSTITETLVNTSRKAIIVTYRIQATANGCPAPAFDYQVTINPTVAPVIKPVSPLCVGERIALSTTQIEGASYSWRGPNGFKSTNLNPLINRASEANDGLYSLVVTVNGCVSDTAYLNVEIVDPPTSDAGTNQNLCASTNSVILQGRIGGGAFAGAWTSSGTGTFSPSNTAVNALYIPSQNDKTSGFVKLALTATSNCASQVSSIDVTFVPIPDVDAGQDIEVCSQNPNVTLNGKISISQNVVWSSSGTGIFQPSKTSLSAIYVPSIADINDGKIVLTLTSVGQNICFPVSDEIQVKILPPPSVKSGQDILLPLGREVTLNPTVNYKDVKYLWTPNVNLSDNTLKNPVLTGVSDQIYKLTVTDSRGCVTEDEIFVDVLMPVITFNTFSPNGDGLNDLWNIPELTTYPYNTVSVFNRYGDKIFSSLGYKQPWDGTYQGAPAPVGTYYYVIDTGFPGLVYSGNVTILR